MKNILVTLSFAVACAALPISSSAVDAISVENINYRGKSLTLNVSKYIYVDSGGRFVGFVVYSDELIKIDRSYNSDCGEDPLRVAFVVLVKPDATRIETCVFLISPSKDLSKNDVVADVMSELVSFWGSRQEIVDRDDGTQNNDAKYVSLLDALFSNHRYFRSFIGFSGHSNFASLNDYYNFIDALPRVLDGEQVLINTGAGQMNVSKSRAMEGCLTITMNGSAPKDIGEGSTYGLSSYGGRGNYTGANLRSWKIVSAALSKFKNTYSAAELSQLVLEEIQKANRATIDALAASKLNAARAAKAAAKQREDRKNIELAELELKYQQEKLSIEAKRDADKKRAIVEEKRKVYAADLAEQAEKAESAADEGKRQVMAEALAKFKIVTAEGNGKAIYGRLVEMVNAYKEIRSKYDALKSNEMEVHDAWLLNYLRSGKAAEVAKINPSAYAAQMEFKPSPELKQLEVAVDSKAADIRTLTPEFESTTKFKLEFALKVILGENL